MVVKLRNLPFKDIAKLFWAFLAIFMAGALLRFLYPHDCPVADAFFALADALMVAGLIGAGLEIFASKFLIEKVADDLAGKLVGRGLPTELQGLIQEITRTKFVRSRYIKTYRISDPDEERNVAIDVRIEFAVRNYSESVEKYAPSVDEETFYAPQFLYLEYGVEGELSQSFKAQELEKYTSVREDNRVKSVRGFPTIKLRPVREDGSPVINVVLHYRVTMPEEYTDVPSTPFFLTQS